MIQPLVIDPLGPSLLAEKINEIVNAVNQLLPSSSHLPDTPEGDRAFMDRHTEEGRRAENKLTWPQQGIQRPKPEKR